MAGGESADKLAIKIVSRHSSVIPATGRPEVSRRASPPWSVFGYPQRLFPEATAVTGMVRRADHIHGCDSAGRSRNLFSVCPTIAFRRV